MAKIKITNITELTKDLRKRTNLLRLYIINILYLSLFKSRGLNGTLLL